MPTATNELLNRENAVQRIARHIADRDVYVITAPPSSLPRLSSALAELRRWHAYLDNGTSAVMRTDRAGALRAAGLLMETAGVILVSKSVPAAELSEVVGQEMPADGSQDLVVLMPTDGSPIFWPLLFVDALAIVDPRVAAQLRAHHIPNQN